MDFFESQEVRIPKGHVRTRFAPSPTGYMHVGGLRTALYAFLLAKQDNGQFLLRIEDTDQERFVEGATEVILRTMRDAGLHYDEGPDIGGPVGPYSQVERKDLYRRYAEKLVATGHAYYCFCQKTDTPDEKKAHIKYDGRCSRLAADDIDEKLASGIPYVIRQKIPVGGATSFQDVLFGQVTIENAELDEGVLIKADGLPTYNFANVVDDHLMGITHIVRGTEYLTSTPKYNLLYTAFGWEIPVYIHVSPVMKNATQKLSKRHGDPTYEDLLALGYLKEAILNYVALLGWSPGGEREKFTLAELVDAFSVQGLSKSPAIFDLEKLTWLNGEYIKALPVETFHALVSPYLTQAVKRPVDSLFLAGLVQSRCGKLTDVIEMLDFLDVYPSFSTDLYIHKKMKTDAALASTVLAHIQTTLTAADTWTMESLHEALMALVTQLGLKNGQVLFPLRVAVSGKESTPCGGIEICVLLGKEESLTRIDASLKQLQQ